MGGEAGPALQGVIRGGGGKGDVHRAGFEQAEHLGAAAADDLEPDARVLAVEGVQVSGEEKAGDCIAGADDQRAQQQLLGLRELVLSGGDESQGAADVLVEHLALPGQGDAPGTAGKKTGLQGVFQLLDRLTYRGLGNIEILGGHGDVAGLGNLLEHAIQLQLDCHGGSS